jgi:hypothetical protein
MSKESTLLPEVDNFGAYLRDTRLTHRINLESVAAETKIRVGLLEAIEKEDHDRLPPPAYVRGMIRTYAKVIGADPQEAIRRYNNHCRFDGQLCVAAPAPLAYGRLRRWPWLLASLILAITLVAGVAYMLVRPGSTPDLRPEAGRLQPAPQPGTKEQAAAAQPSVTDSESETSGRLPSPAASDQGDSDTLPQAAEAAAGDGYLLNITVNEKTYLKVLIDDQEPMEYTLNTGDRLDLEAARSINMLIGNAGGVQLSLNGKPYPVPGKSGQVVNVVIP